MKILYTCVCIALYASAYAQPTQPSAPVAGNVNNCSPAASESCSSGSTVVTSFTGATLRSGTANTVGAVYSFYNVSTVSGKQINATITIDGTLNVSMSPSQFSIDDDAATDHAGTSIASFFAPRITPSAVLTNTDLRGYVQFTIKFFVENGTAGEQYPGDYTNLPPLGGLTGLNYIHYDIDGSTVGNGGWFRETGVVQNVPGSVINSNVPTELVSYSYTDGSGWKGFAGSVYERTGVSRCAQVAVAAQYATQQAQITVRMGYDYNYNGTSYNSQPTRQYGSRFGCFAFPQQGSLPVLLKSFTADREQQASNVSLKWTSSTEISNAGFEVQRNAGNDDWTTIAFIASKALDGNSSTELNYSYSDFNNSKTVTQYRLRQVDQNGKFKFSDIRSVRGLEQKAGRTIVYPNPSDDGRVNIVFDNSKELRNISLVDMSGRTIKQWKECSYSNITIENLNPGMYSLRTVVLGTGEQSVEKIIINKR